MNCLGIGTRPGVLPEIIPKFVKTQAAGAKYILSVCTGAEVLAKAGVLDGLRATTNKSLYKDIEVSKFEKWLAQVFTLRKGALQGSQVGSQGSLGR